MSSTRPVPIVTVFWNTELSACVSSVSRIVYVFRRLFSRFSSPSIRLSAFATLIASTDPNISPSRLVTSPVDSLLSMRKRRSHRVAALTVIMMSASGRNTANVTSGLIWTMMYSATAANPTSGSANENRCMYLVMYSTSSLNLVTASPVDSGSARLPGWSSTWSKTFLRSRVANVNSTRTLSTTFPNMISDRPTENPTSNAARLQNPTVAACSFVMLSNTARVVSAIPCGISAMLKTRVASIRKKRGWYRARPRRYRHVLKPAPPPARSPASWRTASTRSPRAPAAPPARLFARAPGSRSRRTAAPSLSGAR